MKWFNLEQSVLTYWADFVIYALAVVVLAAFATFQSPRALWLSAIGFAAVGFVAWSLVEYLMHRFVLHVLQPFKRWHGEHHRRPGALMATPTWISAGLISVVVFAPLAIFANAWIACAFTFGFLSGYLVYTMTHHATHHWRPGSRWAQGRKRTHARHHHNQALGDFGVTTRLWDYVFGTTTADQHKDL
jgi:sterol desaturase/sphingolipid hydroxylase (fatty acid hydroxylase superfamily)